MKTDKETILGLDLGTNSIGWALVEIDHKKGTVKIRGLGSRILPMNAGEIKDFESKGKINSTAAQRTEKRGSRRLIERYKLRRDRLHLVLNLLGSLPKDYKLEIDFTNKKGEKCGQFKKNKEPKLAYLPKQKGEKAKFLFIDSYHEMLGDINENEVEDTKGKRIPYDWTLYYLRQKALSKEISLEELAWVLLSYNQKRGYEKTEVVDKAIKDDEIVDEMDLRVIDVIPKVDKEEKQFYEIHLDGNDNFVYNEYSDVQMTFEDDLKEVIKTSKVDPEGNIENKKTEFKVVDIYPLKIKDVCYEKDSGKHKYTLTYQNGWQELKQPKNFTFRYKNALNKTFDYIVETVYDNQGKIKTQQGKERILREPDLSEKSSDWTLLKKKTEKEALTFNIEHGYKNKDGSVKNYISPKIYNVLKNDAKSETGKRTRIIGGMFQVVDRDFYRDELSQIIATQKQFHIVLEDQMVFEECVRTLYPKNKNHQKALLKNKKAIQHLLVEDILLYQRPLKSKKSEIANCKYEIRYWKNIEDKNGHPIEEVDSEPGDLKVKKKPIYIKVVSASHPYFQEFRIWDKLHNLRLIQLEKEVDGKKMTNQDITKEYFKTEKEYQELFDELNKQKSLNQKQFLDYCKKKFNLTYTPKNSNYAWNFPEDEEIKGNETRVSIATRFNRCGFTDYADFLTQEKELELWHYLFSVSLKERTARNNKSTTNFFDRYLEGSNLTEEVKGKIIKDFVNFPKFPSKYCAYSEKALKKLLPFVRMGNVDFQGKFDVSEFEQDLKNIKFNKANIPDYLGTTKERMASLNDDERRTLENKRQQLYEALWKDSLNKRIELVLQKVKQIDFNAEQIDYSKAINTKVDLQKGEIPFPKGLFNTFKNFGESDDFKTLNLTQASYLVYGRHSELAEAIQWQSPDDIRKKLHQELKQHSLNNPIAEKVILEMMQVVADIWDYYGEKEVGSKNPKKLFDRIHLEVGRDLKKSAKEKEADSKRMSGNKAQNKRIRKVLEEFLANSSYNAKPGNSDHFERLKIVEEAAEHRKNIDKEFFNDKPYTKKDIEEILKKQSISKTDFEKYKLWIEQGYRSPYSGRMIQLTELFDGDKYNIDHIFPRKLITNNSLSNKVVVEVDLNKCKGNRTARAFIQSQNGHPYLNIPVCTEEEFVRIVETQFSGTKRYILLSKDIPKGFTDSQMNNARHIARKAMELLSHIVREPGEVEFRSKNVLPVTGKVTSQLKRAWQLNHVWTELVSPRFIRLNQLIQPELFNVDPEKDKSFLFGRWKTSNGHKYFDCNLDESIRDKDETYNIKRIDHRQHALDALIVALCTQDHVNYINNINSDAKSGDYGKQKQIERYRQNLKRKIMFTKKDDERDEYNWYFMLPGEDRHTGAENSQKDSVLEKFYLYKDSNSFGQDYKKMILTALQDTIVTFKQNLRVINKTVNWHNNTPNKNKKKRQEPKTRKDRSENKYNWAIRRSLGKGTFYSKIDIGERENKRLISKAEYFYNNIDVITDGNLRRKIQEIKKASSSEHDFKNQLKKIFGNITVECISYKAASRFNSELNTLFNSDKISTIVDTEGQTKAILTRHLNQFDSVELPFEEAVRYFDMLLEKQELEAIVNNNENKFQSIDDLITYLKENNYKYAQVNYKNLNVFIDKLSERNFRSEKQFQGKFKEHPEIAFTPEAIEKMNEPEELKKLNNGKSHKPILKVKTFTGFGKQRAVSEDALSVKSKQYVVNDAGSNIYMGVYEAHIKGETKRSFQSIGLLELISLLKEDKDNRFNPLPEKIYDDLGNVYTRKFTLSPLDLVYMPTQEEINNQITTKMVNLSQLEKDRIFAVNDLPGTIYFFPNNFASAIIEKETDMSYDIKKKRIVGSYSDKTASMDGLQIKDYCWKLEVDRLGNIISVSQ